MRIGVGPGGVARLRKVTCALSMVCGVAALFSCAPAPPVSDTPSTHERSVDDERNLGKVYSQLAASEGKVFVLRPELSTVRIYVFRAGRGAKVGHNHVLSAPRFTGFFYLPPGGTSQARFDLDFRFDQLEIDNPRYRSGLGSAFDSVVSQDAIDGTREHMLGEDNMQAARFPFVRIHSLQLSGESPRFAANVQVELHGQKREMWIPLSVDGLPSALSVSGSFVLRQSDFGATPYSVLGGLLAVQDEIVIEFTLVGSQ